MAREKLEPGDLARRIDCDGALEPAEMTHDFAALLRGQVWGQGFPEPRFRGRFTVEEQRVVGEKHLKATLAIAGRRFGAIRFGSAEALPRSIDAIYRLDVNEFRGSSTVQLVLEHAEAD